MFVISILPQDLWRWIQHSNILYTHSEPAISTGRSREMPNPTSKDRQEIFLRKKEILSEVVDFRWQNTKSSFPVQKRQMTTRKDKQTTTKTSRGMQSAKAESAFLWAGEVTSRMRRGEKPQVKALGTRTWGSIFEHVTDRKSQNSPHVCDKRQVCLEDIVRWVTWQEALVHLMGWVKKKERKI